MTTKDNINKVLAGLAAVNRHDVDGFVSLLEPGFKLHVILKPEQLMPQGRLSGQEGFATYLNMIYAAFPDVQFQQQSISGNGNMVYQDFLIVGKHSGQLVLPTGMKMPATNLKVRLPVEVFHTFNNQGGFISSTGYANLLDVLNQLKG